MTNFERKNEPARGSRRGRSGQHITTTATVFFGESVAATRHEKAENLGAKLGGNVPEALRTLAQETKRSVKLACESTALQGVSERVDLAAAVAMLLALDVEVRKELASYVQRHAEAQSWQRPKTRSPRPAGVVIIDVLTAWRGALCRFGETRRIDDRFSIAVLPLQALVGFVRQHTGEDVAELADAAGLLYDAAAAGLVPAIVCVGSTLVVVGGRWPLPQLEGSK